MSAYTQNSRFGTSSNGTLVTEETIKNYQYQVTGKLHHVEDAQTFGSGFTVRKFVIMDDSGYPSPISFELIKEDVSSIDRFSLGDRLKITFKLKGREWNGRYFTDLKALRVESETESSSPKRQKEDVPF